MKNKTFINMNITNFNEETKIIINTNHPDLPGTSEVRECALCDDYMIEKENTIILLEGEIIRQRKYQCTECGFMEIIDEEYRLEEI
jgi:hypothetical protein